MLGLGVSLGLTDADVIGVGKNPRVQENEGFGVGVHEAEAVPPEMAE